MAALSRSQRAEVKSCDEGVEQLRDICVLFTANDAYMRDFHLVVPADCVASQDAEENRHALRHMKRVLKADIRPSTALNLNTLMRHSGGQK
jgi:isochorismate hydrolase